MRVELARRNQCANGLSAGRTPDSEECAQILFVRDFGPDRPLAVADEARKFVRGFLYQRLLLDLAHCHVTAPD